MLIVLGCTGRKRAGTRAAVEKYRARQYGAALGAFLGPEGLWMAGHDVAVLSAEFGVLAATDPVPDYDREMDRGRAAELAADPRQYARFLALAEGHDEVAVHAGAAYRGVVAAWCARAGIDLVEVVGENRGNGDHYSALVALLESPVGAV